MGFLDKAKAAAEQAANRANETVSDVQTKRELTKAYGEFGETAFKLADSGAISHPELESQLAHIRELQAKLEDEASGNGAAAADAPPASPQADPTEAVEQPLSGAGPGAA
jgi:hypothetical protein